MHRLRIGTLVVALLTVSASNSIAQTASNKKKAPPKPGPVQLQAKDGMELSGYYFGSNKGKEAIPVLIVHEWKGEKTPYGRLCAALQSQGCAVLAMDYRGHGGSREYTDRFGKSKEFDLKTMNKGDIASIVALDLEAAKDFLVKENNEEKLNLNALVVIGSREGCVLAATWAQRDWRFPSIGSRKQGQDVKALVLLSPKRLLRGMSIDNALKDPNLARLPTMVVVGEGSAEESDAERVIRRIEVVKKKLSGKKQPEGLEVMKISQPLGGAALVQGSPKVIPEVVKFITENIEISDVDNPWIERN